MGKLPVNFYSIENVAKSIGGTVVWKNDSSPEREVQIDALVKTESGYAHIRASGCSCWDGEWWHETTYKTISEAKDIVNGLPADVRNDAFNALQD